MCGRIRDAGGAAYDEGRASMDKGDLNYAINCFERALSHRVHFKTLELLGECYLKTSRFDQAIIYLAAAVTLNKGVRAASLLATAFYDSGDDKYRADSLEFVNLVLQRDPKNRNALSLKEKLTAKSPEADPSTSSG